MKIGLWNWTWRKSERNSCEIDLCPAWLNTSGALVQLIDCWAFILKDQQMSAPWWAQRVLFIIERRFRDAKLGFESRHYPKLAHRVCRWITFSNYFRQNRRQTFIRVNADAEPHNRSSWTNFPKMVSEVDCSAGGKFQRRKVVADCWKAFWSFPFASCPGILCVHQAAGFKKGKQKTVSDKKPSWHKNFSFGKNFHRNINFHSKR